MKRWMVVTCVFFFGILSTTIARTDNTSGRANGSAGTGFSASPLHHDTLTFTDIGAGIIGGYFSSVVWGDYDNDGDLDLLVNGATDTDSAFTRVYRNDGGTFVDIHAPLIGVQSAHSESWVDYDNDGDLDIMIQGATGVHNYQPVSKIYRNDNGTFVDINADIIGVVYGSTSWGDFDNDGDLDLLITGSPDGGYSFVSRIYRNDNGVFHDIHAGLPGVWGSSAAWGDYNNDGRLDIALSGYGDWGVTTAIFRNDDSVFTNIHAPLAQVDHSSLAWGDFDNDGDLDLLISGLLVGGAGPFTTIYRNDGGEFVDVHPGIANVMTGAVAWGDFDNDGRLDVAVSGSMTFVPGNTPMSRKEMMISYYLGKEGYVTDPVTKLYHNETHHDTVSFKEVATNLPGLHNASISWGDFDNDGDLDLAISGGTSFSTEAPPFYPITRIYRNEGGSNAFSRNLPPLPPAGLTANVNSDTVRLSWGRSTDDHTPQDGLLYNLRLGTSSGGTQMISPYANAVTGYQRIPKMPNANNDDSWMLNKLPPGTYYWSVQAVDNAYAGSPFAVEQSFTIGGESQSKVWRMISVPYAHADMSVRTLYPAVSTPVYEFSKWGGYAPVDSMVNGFGYWIKSSASAPPIPLSGGVLTSLAVPLHAGWNMVGSISTSISTASIMSDPVGVATSSFFRYAGSYVPTDSLRPGEGYWVKVPTDVSLLFTASAAAEPAPHSAIRIIPDGEFPPAPPGEQSADNHISAGYGLDQNYPNPFNPRTNITFKVPVTGQVSLKIYDVLGREIGVLVNEVRQAGEYTVRWSGGGAPSGVYYCRMAAGSYSQVRAMLLLK